VTARGGLWTLLGPLARSRDVWEKAVPSGLYVESVGMNSRLGTMPSAVKNLLTRGCGQWESLAVDEVYVVGSSGA